MQRTIIILIAAFNVDNLKDIDDDYYTRWKIMEENRKIPLTNVFDLVIIELGKAKKLLKEGKLKAKGNLGEWINFFIKPYEVMEEKKMDELDEKIRKAYEEFQKLNENEEERNLAEHRYMELKRIKHLKEYEFKSGIAEGEKQKQLEIAKKMLEDKVEVETIIKYTGLTKEEIENIR
jgi:predicted transposase/invertase (TIGR01784 family)